MRTRTARALRLTCVVAVAAATVSVATPATAAPRGQTVTAGNARFQVLSPTVIRTEYAGDGRFTDAATFNAVGRGAFTPTPYTSTVSGGVLTIRTSATTLTYRLDSGPFDGGNLEVRTTAGATPVLAAPWRHLTCRTGALCEAEDLTADGLGVATDHRGYTGEGFLAGFESAGTSATADVEATAAGTYALAARYANGQGGDGQHVTRTLSVSVDGGAPQKLTLPVTADWDTWAVASVPVTLGAGHHSVRLQRTAADSGNVNVDALAALPAG
ncbi:CBM35 domain-containing protein, partial [Amycolatopsis sp. SID8362]|uniref:carbohydrate-binding protein n=1 Tax=Amycolatopsis sp. SID8362 TaxID=2690346 RepID=UPI00136D66BB